MLGKGCAVEAESSMQAGDGRASHSVPMSVTHSSVSSVPLLSSSASAKRSLTSSDRPVSSSSRPTAVRGSGAIERTGSGAEVGRVGWDGDLTGEGSGDVSVNSTVTGAATVVTVWSRESIIACLLADTLRATEASSSSVNRATDL